MDTNNSFELVCDILNGCIFTCNDCYIDRNSINSLNSDFYNNVNSFFDMFDAFAVTIGHTDIFTANNTTAILNDVMFDSLLRRFERVVVNSTLVKINEEVLERLSTYSCVQINIVIPLSKITNKVYLRNIRKHIDIIRQKFTRTKLIVHPQLNTPPDNIITNYDELNELYEDIIGFGVDFNPSFIMSDTLSVDEKISHYRTIRDSIDSSDIGERFDLTYRHVDVASKTDLLERPILYSKGKFYIVPSLYAHCNLTDSALEFKDISDYIRLINQLQEQQYQYAYKSNSSECANCHNISICVIRNTLYVMENLETYECLLPKNVIEGFLYGFNNKTN